MQRPTNFIFSNIILPHLAKTRSNGPIRGIVKNPGCSVLCTAAERRRKRPQPGGAAVNPNYSPIDIGVIGLGSSTSSKFCTTARKKKPHWGGEVQGSSTATATVIPPPVVGVWRPGTVATTSSIPLATGTGAREESAKQSREEKITPFPPKLKTPDPRDISIGAGELDPAATRRTKEMVDLLIRTYTGGGTASKVGSNPIPIEVQIDDPVPPEIGIKKKKKKRKSKRGPPSPEVHPQSASPNAEPEPNSPNSSTSQTPTAKPQSPPIPQQLANHLDPLQDLPLPIFDLLKKRLFRYAVFHILRTPEYATDSSLVRRVGKYLTRRGAGKLAEQLQKVLAVYDVPVPVPMPTGSTLDTPSTTTVGAGMEATAMTTVGISSNASTTQHQHEHHQHGRSKPRLRLWPDPEPKDRPRRPPDHWRSLTTASGLPNPPPPLYNLYNINPSNVLARGGILSSSTVTDQDIPLPEVGDLTAEQQTRLKKLRTALLTRYYNTQLSSLMTLPHPLSSKIKIPPPNPSFQQLQYLIRRIQKLEATRGFIPDRVTGNIIIKCWLRCVSAFTPGSSGGLDGLVDDDIEVYRRYRVVIDSKIDSRDTSVNGNGGRRSIRRSRIVKKHPAERESEKMELQALWALVKRLMDFQASSTSMQAQDSSQSSSLSMLEESVDYDRHVKPFCAMMIRAFKNFGDDASVREVVIWQAQQRDARQGKQPES